MDTPVIKIAVKEGSGEETFYFGDERITIGRSSGNAIRLKDKASSRHHCIIEVKEDRYWIEDLRSANSTKVNGETITRRTLNEGDRIQIGNALLVVFLEQSRENLPLPTKSPGSRKELRRKNVRSRRSTKNFPILPVIYAALVLFTLGIGVKIYNYIHHYSLYQHKYNEALSMEKDGQYEKAVSLLEEIQNAMPDTEISQKAARALRRVKDKQEAYKTYEELKHDYEEQKYDAQTYLSRLEELQRKFPNSAIERLLALEIERVNALSLQQGKKPLQPSDTDTGSTTALANETKTPGDENVESPQRTDLPDTVAVKQLFEEPRIKAAIKKSAWKEVVDILEDYKSKNPQNSQAVQEYVEEIKALPTLEEAFFQALASGNLKSLSLDLGDKKWRVLAIQKNKLQVVQEGHEGTAWLKWEDIAPVKRLKLLRNLPFSYKNSIALATYGMVFSEPEEADKDLISLLHKMPESKPAVDNFLSRWRGVPVPDGGFVVHRHRLVAAGEKMLLCYREDVRQLFSGDSKAEELNANLEKLYDRAGSQDRKVGEQMRQMLAQELVQQRKELIDRIKKKLETSSKQMKSMERLHIELKNRREHALALIRDEEKYRKDIPSAEEVQKEVDKRVAAVRETWENTAGVVMEFSPQVMALQRQVEVLDAFVEEKFPEYSLPEDEEVESIKALVSERLNIQNYARTSQERKRILYNQKILEENDKKTGVATEAERQQVRITNEYRHMMGLYCLKLNDSLTMAARGHSQYLKDHDIFAHEVKGEPAGETPTERAKTAGYPAAIGENILMGTGDPTQAHAGWLHSPGHHRNILDPQWRAMGAGLSGDHWTQNFGPQ